MINLSETYTYEGHKNWQTGKRVTAQRKIKTGDAVKITFLGASEENIHIEEFNGCWDVYENIPVIGENYYFEVVVNNVRTYYGKYVGYRYTESSKGTGGIVYRSNHDCIDEEQVRSAFGKFKEWLRDGAKNNNYWHGLYVKKEFPETIAYCMPGEVIEPVIVKANGLTEGEEFTVGVFTFKVLSAEGATVAVTGHTDELPEILDIPGHVSLNGMQLTVSEIGESAFYKCEGLREVTIPETIVAISDSAFDLCKGVRKFTSLARKPPVLVDPSDEDAIVDPFWQIDRNDCILYVPEKAVDKYRSPRKNIRGWGHFFHHLPIGGRLEVVSNDSIPVFDKSWKKVSFIDGKPSPKLKGIQKIWVKEGTKELPDEAFSFLEDLNCVYIPSSVKKMGKESFSFCHNLEHIYFEDASVVRFDSLEGMFYSSDRIKDWSFLKNWNTKGVKNMSGMFRECDGLKDLSPLSGWDMGDVEDISSMFEQCESLIDLSPLSGWDVSSVKNASRLFSNSGITSVRELSEWDTRSFENISHIFCGCDRLTGIDGLGKWDTSQITNMHGTFLGCLSVKDFRVLASWNTGKVRDMGGMFAKGEEGAAPLFPNFASWDTGQVETLSGFFRGRKDIKDLSCLTGMNLKRVSSIDYAFCECDALSDISALATWDVSSIVVMRSLFDESVSLEGLSPIAGWDVRRCKDLSCMFGGCESLKSLSGLEDWNLESATSLDYMFALCSQLTDISALSSWNVRRMESLRGLFRRCSRLSDLSALSSWDVSNVEDVSSLFKECESLEDLSPLRDWDTSLFLNLESMFEGCTSLVDVSPIAHWNMRRKEKHFNSLFEGCSKLTEVGCLDWRHGSAYITDMFTKCGASSCQMENAYKSPKEPEEKKVKTVESFEVKEGAGGVLEFISGSLRFEMVPVEGGTYTMGFVTDDPNYRYSYENKPREETVKDFYICRTQVTQALWEAVMGSNPSLIQGPKLPVEWVSPEECLEFVKRLSKITGLRFTLPTQAEWEYAARGGKYSHGYRFAGSDNIDEVAWHVGNTKWSEHPVGLKKPNELGLYDMTGNVNEMCLDRDDYYTDSHIARGGSFTDSAKNWCKITHYCYSSSKTNHIGLRLVLHK
jgi:surface protein